MVKVLLADPALAALADRFAERLPDDVAVARSGRLQRRGVPSSRRRCHRARECPPADRCRDPCDGTRRPLRPDHRRRYGRRSIARPSPTRAWWRPSTRGQSNGRRRAHAHAHAGAHQTAARKRSCNEGRPVRARRDHYSSASTIWRMQPSGSWAWATSGRPWRSGLSRRGRIVYQSRRQMPDIDEGSAPYGWSSPELLRRSNIVTLHVPLTPETHHPIGAGGDRDMPPAPISSTPDAAGSSMKPPFVTRSTGATWPALALDVLEHETDGLNPFADVPEIIVTPHLGGGSRNSMNGVVERSTANIRLFSQDRRWPTRSTSRNPRRR